MSYYPGQIPIPPQQQQQPQSLLQHQQQLSNQYGNPNQQQQYNQYNSNQQPLAPPSSYGGPTSLGPPSYSQQAPSSQQQPGQFHQAPPSSHYGAPAAAVVPKPANVQFFSLQGGTPTPSSTTIGAPPASSAGGGGNLPYGTSGGGMSGMMPPPPSGMGGGVAPPFYSAPPGAGGIQPPGSMMTHQPGLDGQMYGAPPPNGMMNNNMPPSFESQKSVGMGMSGMNSGGTATTPMGGGGVGQNLNDMSGISQGPGCSLPSLADIDTSIQCDPNFLKSTIGKIHVSQSAANATRLPIGIICKPMCGDIGTSNEQIEVVDFGSTGIVRCKRCRTYINPYVAWADNGRRWRCNICGMLNDVSTSYFSHLDANGRRRDRDQRPELSKCSVEFVAPGDYMVRPPQPPVYMFVIDVSSTSAQSGMLESCCRAIKQSLDELPGAPRTLIGFITFDSSIHFYNLKSTLAAPQMLVVSDLNEILLPLPEDLLVNLQDSRKVVESLLDALPNMFHHNNVNVTCTGPALQAAKKVISHIGGKLCLFQSSLPTLGEGSLKVRDNPRILGTDKEHLFLAAEDAWYKNNGVDFSRLQICIDTFLFSAQYTDLATLSQLSKLTAGSTYYYPGFFGKIDGKRFEKDLSHVLTRSTAFEAVMRVRATKGLRITMFYGNHYVRGQDLLALPNCTSDSTFALDLNYDEPNLAAQVITIQAALLYTSSCGERRIRIHTHILPVTQSIPEVIDTIDIDSIVNILLKQAIEIAQKTGLENARNRVHQIAVEMLRGSRHMVMNQYGMPQQQIQPSGSADGGIPPALQLIPLYAMSIQKCLAIRGGSEVRLDERAYYHALGHNMDTEESKAFIYPRLFSLHDMTADVGLPSDNIDEDISIVAGPFRIKLPTILNLSQERFVTEGLFLLENGVDIFLWVGRNVSPVLMESLFGVGITSLDHVDMSLLEVRQDNETDFASRVNAVVMALRQTRGGRYMQLRIIREGDGPAEAYLARYYVEDRAPFPGGQMAYAEYHNFVTRQVSGAMN